MEVNIFWVVGSAIGSSLITYLTTYTNAKAKFQAELETKAKITEEQERVIASYKLDHEKRKYQYEKKHEVYSKYHNLLDKFDGENNPFRDKAKLDTLLSTMLETMKSNPENAGVQMKAINTFSNEIRVLVRVAFSEMEQIAKQTNELKLVASNEICDIVQEIDKNYSQVEQLSSSIFEDPLKLLSNQDVFSSVNSEIKRIHGETTTKKLKLIELMRADLENI